MDEKHILTYNLSLKKCYLGSDSSKPNSKPKNNTFQYHKDEKHNKNFARMNFKLNIYKNQKHILTFLKIYL